MYEGSLCVCCMSTEDLLQLFSGNVEDYPDANYAKKLSACLNIEELARGHNVFGALFCHTYSKQSGIPSRGRKTYLRVLYKIKETDGHDFICTICVTRLNECVAFKRQALKSIAILSSIDITKLVSQEELQILELNEIKKEQKPIINTESPKNETKTTFKDIDIKLSSCDTNIKPIEDRENLTAPQTPSQTRLQVNKPQSTKPIKLEPTEPQPTNKQCTRLKRPIGRPRTHSPDTVPYEIKKDELVCRECGEEFPTNITLKVHYNSHFGRHKCSTCNKSFMAYNSLKKHQTSHLRGPFRCKDCGKEFYNLNTLHSHKRYKHTNSLPYRCSICGLGLRTFHRRLQHMAKEHSVLLRKHQCPYCDKRFRHSGERAKHISSQHDVKFFPCLVCGVRCRRATLRKHMQTHLATTDVKPVDKPKERRFVCKLCSKDFTQKKSVKYHIGSHIRHGDYEGDPNYLIFDRRTSGDKETGLLSEDLSEQHLDEALLSDDLKDIIVQHIDEKDMTFIDIDTIDKNINVRLSGEDLDDTHVHEICTTLGFSIPSDFDD